MVLKTTAAHTGKAQSLTLVILAGIDIVLGVIAVAIAISAGWPGLDNQSPDLTSQTNMIVGSLYLILFIQTVFRVVMLIVMAWWSFRLVSNAHRHIRFPVSTRWAWLGWFVPVASLWLPMQTLLNLNLAFGRLSGLRRLLILSWWGTRLLVSPSCALISMTLIGIFVRLNNQYGPNVSITIHWLLWMMVIGVISQCLAIAVVMITKRHQPKPGESATAELF